MSKRWKAVTGEETNRPYLPDLAWSAALFLMLLVPVTMRWDPLAEFDRVVVAASSDPVARLDTAHSVVNAVTFVGGGEVSALLLSLATVWFLFRRANRSALYVALAGLGAAILDQGVKALVERARPVLDVAVAAPGASFPSGHTMNATITYGVLLLVLWPALPSHRRRVGGRSCCQPGDRGGSDPGPTRGPPPFRRGGGMDSGSRVAGPHQPGPDRAAASPWTGRPSPRAGSASTRAGATSGRMDERGGPRRGGDTHVGSTDLGGGLSQRPGRTGAPLRHRRARVAGIGSNHPTHGCGGSDRTVGRHGGHRRRTLG